MAESRGNILITGASGMIGSALDETLRSHGYTPFPLDRHDANAPFHYDQDKNLMHLTEEIPIRAVINLAGAGLADGRWTEARKQRILESRTVTTRLLCEALLSLRQQPEVLLSASAIGYYGDTGQSIVDETDAAGSGFLARVSREWEEAAEIAAAGGIRTVITRLGLVLSPDGGVLEKFILPYRMGAIGRVGSGDNYMPWISLDDVVALMTGFIENGAAAGPINLVSNHEVTNDEFTRTVARALGRPRMPPLPAFMVRLIFGEMGDEALLASNRVRSTRLPELGVTLRDPELLPALRRMLAAS